MWPSHSRMLPLSSRSTRRGSSLTCWFAASTAALALAGSSASQAAVISSIVDVSALARVWGMSSGSSLPQPARGMTASSSPSARIGRRGMRRPRLAARGSGNARLTTLHCPCWRRSASESGRLAARIAACAPAMSYSARRYVAVQRSVSSSSQAARGSPSRGWPVEPGLISHWPSARSSSVPSLRVVPEAGEPSWRSKDSATWEWPISETRKSVTSKHSSAVSPDRTYSQIGSRGEAWKSPTPWPRCPRA